MWSSSEQDRQVPCAPGLTPVGQTDSNQGNEHRSKMISDLASAVENVKWVLTKAYLRRWYLSWDLKDRKEPVTGKSGKRTFHAKGITFGKSPKMGVSRLCLGQRGWSSVSSGESRDMGQDLMMRDLLVLAKSMLRRNGQSGYYPTPSPFLFQWEKQSLERLTGMPKVKSRLELSSRHRAVHHKYIEFLFVSYTLIWKLEREKD